MCVLNGKLNEGQWADVPCKLQKDPATIWREWPRFFFLTEMGYLNADTFEEVMDLFAEKWGVRNPGREALLFGDQLGSHKKVKTIESALLKGVFLSFFATNSSLINKPLDEMQFASDKKSSVARGEQAKNESMVIGSLARDSILGAVFTAMRRAFTPAHIRGRFRRCALWSLDTVTMTRRCREATGMLSHRGILSEEATAAASEVIRASAERTTAAAARLSTGKETVRRKILHSAADLLAQHAATVASEAARVANRATVEAEKKAEHVKKAAEVVLKAAAMENTTSRACAKTRPRTGTGWAECPCGAYWMCPTCRKADVARANLGKHLGLCTGKSTGAHPNPVGASSAPSERD